MAEPEAVAVVKTAATVMMPPYPDRFYAAARFAAIPGTVEVAPGSENTTPYSDLTCLALYSLYQQAAHGPCTQPKPWAWNIVELAKWQSWKELSNMHRMEAMRLFVRALEEEEPDWWLKAQELEAQAAAEEEEAAAQEQAVEDEELEGVHPGTKSPKFPVAVKSPARSPGGIVGGATAALTPKLSLTNGTAEVGASPLPPVVTSLASQLVEACQTVSTWAVVPTTGRKPAARYQHASIIMTDKMIVVGGNTGRFVNDIQALDLSTLSWSKLEFTSPEAIPPPACAGHALAALDDKTVLVVGGHRKSQPSPSDRLVVLALDLETSTWRVLETAGDIPIARGGHSANRVGNVLWVFGGEDRRRHLLSDVFSLDLTTLIWSQVQTKGSGPSPRSDHSATVYNDRYLTIFGGGSHSFCYNDVYVLDLETAEWSEAPTFGTVPSPRAGHAGVPVGSCWFIVGGGDNLRGLCETMMLDLDTLTWTTITTAQQRTPISSEGLAVVPVESPRGTLLIAFGGYNGRYNNEVLVLRPDPDLLLGSLTPQPNFSNGEVVADLASDGAALAQEGSTGVDPQASKDSQAALATSDASSGPGRWEQGSAAAARDKEGVAPSVGKPAEKGLDTRSREQPVPAQTQATESTPAPSAGAKASLSGKELPKQGSSGAVHPAPAADGPPTGSGARAGSEDESSEASDRDPLARANSFEKAAEARADAWLAIGQANKEVEEMREKVAQALAAKQRAEDELAEGSARVVAAQAASASAQAEAQKLRKDLGESRGRVLELQTELARIGSDGELTKVRRDYGVCKQALAEAEQEVQSVRSLLSAEQARCFKLEVEVAELRQRLSEMSDLKAEMEILRRQKEASEEAAAAAVAAATARQNRSGWFG